MFDSSNILIIKKQQSRLRKENGGSKSTWNRPLSVCFSLLSTIFLSELVIIRIAASGRHAYCARVCVCLYECVLLLLDSKLLCVCSLCLGVSVSHSVCFLEGVRSCFIADAEHKDALSGVWTIGQVWRYGGNRDLCMHTHAHRHTHTTTHTHSLPL